MIKRIVANGKFKDKAHIFEAIMESKQSFTQHFIQPANRIELTIDSLEDLRMHSQFQSDARMETVEITLGMVVVIDESLKTDLFKLVFEKTY